MTGSAVLVHGAWSSPEEWCFVDEGLWAAGVEVLAVDLPSHRSATAKRAQDVAVVEEAIAAASPPIVVVGWSYGGALLTECDLDEERVARLVYVASLPDAPPSDPDDRPTAPPLDPANFDFPNDETIVLRDDWWKDTGRSPFSAAAIHHLRDHPRRPVSIAALVGPAMGHAWGVISTTLLLGRDDNLIPPELQEWASRNFPDVRIIDCDHFVPLRAPDHVVAIVLEALVPH
ncbi:MAG: alpha/beta hydrolase [Acidimicrobiia bacterium]|nr:alpha/beta hydrolase [Acidimicrobiia bacterium]